MKLFVHSFLTLRNAMPVTVLSILTLLVNEAYSHSVNISGNAMKPYFFWFMRRNPTWRRQIEPVAPVRNAQRRPLAHRAIPRIVWQTNFTERVEISVATARSFNRRIAPTHEFRFMDDATCDAFVEEHYSGRVAAAYRRLNIGAARADLWRILVLLKHGGLYLDIDANLVSDPDRVIGPDETQVLIHMPNGEITNYFLASAPGNPLFAAMADAIVNNIESGRFDSIYEMTGPTAIEKVARQHGIASRYFKYVCMQGQFTDKRLQYMDKKGGRWQVEQVSKPILKPLFPDAAGNSGD